MRAMVMRQAGVGLKLEDVPKPVAGPGQVLIRIEACGVCRTDLHILDGELTHPHLPLVPGHEIVGRIAGIGANITQFRIGERVGVPWLASTCGHCRYCKANKENLCDEAKFTGYDVNGGYADYCAADGRFCFPLPDDVEAASLAPLMCAGLIGFRSLRLAGPGKTLGIFGFGAAAHLVTQVAIHQHRQVHAFTRPGDKTAQALALSLGCATATGSDDVPVDGLDAAIIFAPAGELIPLAAAPVQAVASCSNQPGWGLSISIPARPSATRRPALSQAMALVAVVDESRPMTRSGFMRGS
jgi:propanol-preferring alcohol dehydrogenase